MHCNSQHVAALPETAGAPVKRDARWPMLPCIAAFAGVLLLSWLVHRSDTSALMDAVRTTLPWVPLLLLLEGLRIFGEAYATRLLVRSEAVSVACSVRLQLVANACSLIFPAGRLAGEALKIASFAPLVGSGRATAVGVVNQVLNLLANGVVSLLAAAAALLMAVRSEIAWALAGNALLLLMAALGVQLAARGRMIERLLGRFARFRAAAAGFRDAASFGSLVPTGPALAFLLGRLMQLSMFVVLFAALSDRYDPLSSVVAQGLTVVASTVADAVPAQMGATEFALTSAAADLRMDAAAALTLALVFRGTQLFWAFAGALTAATLRSGSSSPRGSLKARVA